MTADNKDLTDKIRLILMIRCYICGAFYIKGVTTQPAIEIAPQGRSAAKSACAD
jgi:hypothetical protein